MLALVPFLLASPWMFCAAIALVAITAGIAAWRKLMFPRLAMILLIAGATGLALAAGKPIWRRPQIQRVAVMVDLSPSTRGAQFRDRNKLEGRIHELLGDTPYQLWLFADANHPADLSTPLREIPVDQTVFSPPAAAAILLFSDARFALPSAAPVYPVIDPGLEDVDDAAVMRLELRGQTVAATIAGGGGRVLSMQGVTAPAPPGVTVITQPLQKGVETVIAQLNGTDRWPENDSMSLRVSPPLASEKWWIGSRSPGAGWRSINPADIPLDAASYLAPSVIVLDNLSATQLGPAAMDRLAQYTRDLGGSLLILGGNNAFAAGTYTGTPLEELSPLASSPPQPTMLWMLLADSSGSMSADAGGISRWGLASAAIVKLLPELPPDDPVQVGQFSDVERWWPVGKNAGQTTLMPLPPPGAVPHGPTNLESSLNHIAGEADSAMPKQLLVLSDCDTRIDHPDALIELLKSKKIRLHVLAIGNGSGLAVIGRIAQATGGAVLEQFDPKQWAESIRKLMQAVLPQRVMQTAAHVDFIDRAATLSGVDVSVWDRTWLKKDASQWGTTQFDNAAVPMAAYWQVGRGQVAAVAFSPARPVAGVLAALIAMKPRDPRLGVSWDTGSRLGVSIDAVDQKKYLNDLNFTLEIADADSPGSSEDFSIPQVGPGRYELSIAAPRRASIATVRRGEGLIDRIAVAGRYAPEFDALGNDHAAMRELAERSGGEVVWPGDHRTIQFAWPLRDTGFSPLFAAIGALLIAGGLVCWRLAML